MPSFTQQLEIHYKTVNLIGQNGQPASCCQCSSRAGVILCVSVCVFIIGGKYETISVTLAVVRSC